MKLRCFSTLAIATLFLSSLNALGQKAAFHVLAFYSTNVEADHVDFAKQAIQFYSALAAKDHFDFQATTRWGEMSPSTLNRYQVIVWLNDSPQIAAQRTAFEQYMDHGGAWMGFHAAGYNDESTHWPWFVHFLGAVFYGNSWPPLPARLIVDDRANPVTHRLPSTYLSPANEWYSWKPDPRTNKKIKVLLTLDPADYPIGFKDTLVAGDIPVVWTNTSYKMIYVNMGHGDTILTSPIQNRMLEDALLWLGGQTPAK